MRIERYLLDIKERLAPLLNEDVSVELLADVQAEFIKPLPGKKGARVSIVFFEAKPEQTRSIDKIVQHVDLTFHVILNASKLEGKNGIFDLYRRVSNLLVGYDPTDCDALQAGGFMFSRYLSSIWEYAAIYNTHTLIVQEPDEEPTTTVQSITVASEYGQSFVETDQTPTP